MLQKTSTWVSYLFIRVHTNALAKHIFHASRIMEISYTFMGRIIQVNTKL